MYRNIVCTVNLGCKLDLKKIALHARNAEYNPKRFAAVIMRIRDPRTTALIFSSGKMVCTGAKRFVWCSSIYSLVSELNSIYCHRSGARIQLYFVLLISLIWQTYWFYLWILEFVCKAEFPDFPGLGCFMDWKFETGVVDFSCVLDEPWLIRFLYVCLCPIPCCSYLYYSDSRFSHFTVLLILMYLMNIHCERFNGCESKQVKLLFRQISSAFFREMK